jgi:tRNA-specific 2-thiouridylase
MTKERVAVALSGGIDSSVAALLLREAGYETSGVHMRLWDSSCAERLEYQAEQVCRILDIPFHVLDLQGEFERCVIDYFCQEYRGGRTPNPCVACNQYIKFGFLLDRVLALGADHLATGHYARIEQSDGGYHLLRAKDTSKDQSYFLYTLNQRKLRYLLFPLGSHTKTEVRQIAKREGLPTAIKPSQDLCFISEKNYHAFLGRRFSSVPGDIVDTQGTILGHHRGIAFYTIGQRHGFGLASNTALYVTRMEPENNRVVLGSEEELYSREVTARNLSWLAGELPSEPIAMTAKIRYKSARVEAELFPKVDSVDIRFSQPQWAATPGQVIVFYRGDELLGGGIID